MLSVTILAKNSERTLKKTLDSLQNFPEVLVLDTGSTDNTVEIAKGFSNVRVIHLPFEGFGKTHNEASKLARFDWILSIDSDEILSEKLGEEILNLELSAKKLYSIHRNNYYQKKQIKCCSGWYPDWIVRLYNRQETTFSEDMVHEKILRPKGFKVIHLKNPLYHTPYQTISDFLHKMQTYSSLFACMHPNTPSSNFKAFYHAAFAFFKSYILKRGIFGGGTGLMLSFYSSHVAWYKYLKLAEQNRK